MQLVRGVIGERGVMFVKTTDQRIAEDDRAAAIRLESVFVWVDDNTVRAGNCQICRSDLPLERTRSPGEQFKESPVRGIDVDAKIELTPQLQGFVNRDYCAERRRTRRHHDRPDAARLQFLLQIVKIHPSLTVHFDPDRFCADHLAHPAVRVMSLGRKSDGFFWME